jgi:hypothetical protein
LGDRSTVYVNDSVFCSCVGVLHFAFCVLQRFAREKVAVSR